MTEEEKKYRNVISALKSLPKVKAKDDFDQKLLRRLRNADQEKMSPSFQKLIKPVEKNWIFNIFRPAFVPAIGVTIILIAIIVVYINFRTQQDTTVSQNEQQKQELVIKKPATTEGKDLSANRETQPPITHELSRKEFDERYTMPVSPKSEVETESPSVQPEETLSKPPEIEQRIEKKAPEMEEKEMKGDRKVGDMKKNQNEKLPEMKKSEEQSQDDKINDGVLNGVLKPSMGVDNSKAKDTLKIDSIRSKKENGKNIEKNKGETEEQRNQNEKPAEPKKQEPTEENK